MRAALIQTQNIIPTAIVVIFRSSLILLL